jgi:hypothetical protein
MKKQESLQFLNKIINTPLQEEDWGIYTCIWCDYILYMDDYLDDDGYGDFSFDYFKHGPDCPITKAKELRDKLERK